METQTTHRKSKNAPAPNGAAKEVPATKRPGESAAHPHPEGGSRIPPRPVSALPDPFERDSYASTAMQDILDRSVHALAARWTGGLSPSALAEAYMDWAIHLATAPGKQAQLLEKVAKKTTRLANYAASAVMQQQDCESCIEPLPQDRRFRGEAWQKWPFNMMYQSFLLNQQWWHNATTGVRGVTDQHEKAVEFAARQVLDIFAPSNFLLTNPEALQKTVSDGGLNLWRGFQNFLEDVERVRSGRGPVGSENFVPGRDVALTPGKVVLRNRLIELIQYDAATETVRPQPILIVPAWINRYYVLDLSPHNSMVKYLTEQGFTVFMISWLNPGPEDRDLSLDDYRNLGVMAAAEAVQAIVPQQRIHGVGYCLGGTLLALAASALARNDHSPFETLSFLATQVDFTEAGELQLFINESQLAFLEDMMWESGFLDARQMKGAFQLLRSNDLIWSRNMREYLLGERSPMFDLMAWNADSTRMPYRMHSEYLRSLYLNNDLAEGRFKVDGRPVALSDIRQPIFSVGTQTDHVAPWRSVYKAHLLTDTDVTFLLTSGGHNAGIISEPGHRGRTYQVATAREDGRYIDPDSWVVRTPVKAGSWWPEWVAWLAERSGKPTAPPAIGAPDAGLAPIADAPGTYVLMD